MNFSIFLILLVTMASCQINAEMSDVEWVNSKYHNFGSNWKVFTGIIVFIGVLLTLGLICEWSYNRSLNRYLKNEELADMDEYPQD